MIEKTSKLYATLSCFLGMTIIGDVIQGGHINLAESILWATLIGLGLSIIIILTKPKDTHEQWMNNLHEEMDIYYRNKDNQL